MAKQVGEIMKCAMRQLLLMLSNSKGKATQLLKFLEIRWIIIARIRAVKNYPQYEQLETIQQCLHSYVEMSC